MLIRGCRGERELAVLRVLGGHLCGRFCLRSVSGFGEPGAPDELGPKARSRVNFFEFQEQFYDGGVDCRVLESVVLLLVEGEVESCICFGFFLLSIRWWLLSSGWQVGGQ